MRYIIMLWLCLALPLQAQEQAVYPDWFLDSFLELADDAEAADDEGKALMLFFMQEGCPYCRDMANITFTDPEIVARVQRDYHVVLLNIFGSREVTIGENTLEERDFSSQLGVQFTPTLMVFDSNLNLTDRLDGYWPPRLFAARLDGKPVSQRSHQEILYIGWPETCDEACQKLQTVLENRVLYDLSVEQYTQSETTTPQLYFHHGDVTIDTDAVFRSFHFTAILEWLDQGKYQQEPEFQRYLRDRTGA